jgi:hypothetical protein
VNTPNPLTRVFRLPLVEYGGKQPWGNPSGMDVRRKLDAILRDRPEQIVNLDLRGIERLDVSWSREAIANLIHTHRGRRWFFLSKIANASIRENVDAAFVKKEMAIVHRQPDDYEILGIALKVHLLQTLDVVERHGAATARQVCESVKDLNLTACNNRLKDLCDMGLLMRLEGSAPSGGKEYAYVALK